ncbi:HEAT repeat domain-containing protein [candidate division KSB1 bacterium]|nr:HEAT repeat domain-containing protein [Candidatus Aminicenantes bacterium]RQW03581.1 MAG: HEAT repeat domain-containing protein [candidate division KSB1 bacterium]
MALFKPKWQSKNSEVRRAAVYKLEDQGILKDIVKNDKEFIVREAALFKLDDNEQELIASIAKNDESRFVREEAIEKLDPSKWQELLKGVAKNESEHGQVRKKAIAQLTDQALLTEIANTDEAWEVRNAAVQNLTDSSILSKIARSDKEVCVRESAEGRLQDLSADSKEESAEGPIEKLLMICTRNDILFPDDMLPEIQEGLIQEGKSGSLALAELLCELLQDRSGKIGYAIVAAARAESTDALISVLQEVKTADPLRIGSPNRFTPQIVGGGKIGWTDEYCNHVRKMAKDTLRQLS